LFFDKHHLAQWAEEPRKEHAVFDGGGVMRLRDRVLSRWLLNATLMRSMVALKN